MRVEKQILIGDKMGLHLRVASQFAKLATTFECDVSVESETTTADGKSVLEMMLLKAGPGCKLTLRAKGQDAEEALRVLTSYVTDPDGFDPGSSASG